MKRGGGSMIAALILTCLFAMTMLLTLVMGAKVYRGVQQRVEDSAGSAWACHTLRQRFMRMTMQTAYLCRSSVTWMPLCWHRNMTVSAM